MSDTPPPRDTADATFARLVGVVERLAERLGGPPTLGELLDVLGWAVPTGGTALAEAVALPQRFRASLRKGRRYVAQRESRVGELDDADFTEAAGLLAVLAARAVATHQRPVTLVELMASFSSLLTSAHAEGAVAFADVAAGEPIRVTPVAPPKRVPRPEVGDVLAIPVEEEGHRLAVVLARDRFGTALGIFQGMFPLPRIGGRHLPAASPQPVYTDEQLIASGDWRVVGHDESLTVRFPKEPEIYHRADTLPPGTVASEYGAAENAAGRLRAVGRVEAEAVGLLDGGYRQVHLSGDLQRLVAEGAL